MTVTRATATTTTQRAPRSIHLSTHARTTGTHHTCGFCNTAATSLEACRYTRPVKFLVSAAGLQSAREQANGKDGAAALSAVQ